MSTSASPSPFHRGEREIQTRVGVRDQIEDIGQRFIRDCLPDQHQDFYQQLPLLFIGSIDKAGRPWASVLVGHPGFVTASNDKTLRVAARRFFGDPLDEIAAAGSKVGVLGIDYLARRRNRLTGEITAADDQTLTIRVNQTFGNCPQYIQSREYQFTPALERIGESQAVTELSELTDHARNLIEKADNFYIATHYLEAEDEVSQGADVSHRGGKPGFVRVDDNKTLTFPDFSGNFHFNTLGNILLNPLAGLLFIDFDSGDLLYLTCRAEIIWDSEELRAFDGAQQLVRFRIDHGTLIPGVMPIRWDFVDYSPSLEHTGSWKEVAETIRAKKAGNVYRNYVVTRIERESDIVSSFYLEPESDENIGCHKAGQFLPIEIEPDGEEKIRRTYTISNAPNGRYYRLSVKREPAAAPEYPPGVSSNFLHDNMAEGAVIRALSPRGQFTLVESTTRPVVLISAGVGITPMISMLEELRSESSTCGCARGVWFIHGARNGNVHAFARPVRDFTQDWPCLRVHFRYSDPLDTDLEGTDFDSQGRVDAELLKSLLPFDDYDFYLCGPTPFMESVYDGLRELNVSDERIHYEFFGQGSTLKRDHPGETIGLVEDLADHEPVEVQFARSGKKVTWDPSKGTLLDLAESEGLRPAYSCRSGICQTCATRVRSGRVDYLAPPMSDPGDENALICCSYPARRAADDVPLKLDL